MVVSSALRVVLASAMWWLAAAGSFAFAQPGWVGLGPTGVPVSSLAVVAGSPPTIYAGTRGLYKTTDDGLTWTLLPGLSNLFIYSIVLDPVVPTTLYVGTESGAFKSTDGGRSWALLSNSLPVAIPVRLAISASAPSVLYASTIPFLGVGALFRTDDAGTSWQAVPSPIPGFLTVHFQVDPHDSEVVWAGSGQAVFRTSDGGQSWTNLLTLDSYASPSALAIDANIPGRAFVGAYIATPQGGRGGYLSMTTDNGAHWTATLGGAVISIATTVDSSIVYAGTSGPFGTSFDVFQSLGGIEVWRSVKDGLPTSGPLVADPSNPLVVYSGTEDGVYRLDLDRAVILPGHPHRAPRVIPSRPPLP